MTTTTKSAMKPNVDIDAFIISSTFHGSNKLHAVLNESPNDNGANKLRASKAETEEEEDKKGFGGWRKYPYACNGFAVTLKLQSLF